MSFSDQNYQSAPQMSAVVVVAVIVVAIAMATAIGVPTIVPDAVGCTGAILLILFDLGRIGMAGLALQGDALAGERRVARFAGHDVEKCQGVAHGDALVGVAQVGDEVGHSRLEL